MKKNLRVVAIVALLSVTTANAIAQGMAVNNSGAAANASAIFDASSTTQGMLIPRMTNAQMTSISSPATGLLIYCTDCSPAGFEFYNGSSWTSLNSYTNVTNQGNTFNGANQLVQTNASSVVPAANLGTGSSITTKYLRGDNTWQTISGGSGTVTSVSSNVLTSGTTAFQDTIFHTTVINSTTTPSIFYTFNNAAAYSVLTNSTNFASIPVYGKVVPNALYSSSGTPSSTTYYRGDGSWQSISSGKIIFAGECLASNTATLYFGFPASNSTAVGTANCGGVPMPTAMTLTDFYITGTIKVAGGSGNNTHTVTLYKNGSATSFTLNFTALTTDPLVTQYSANMSGSLSVSAGDILSIRLDQSNSGGPECHIGLSFLAN